MNFDDEALFSAILKALVNQWSMEPVNVVLLSPIQKIYFFYFLKGDTILFKKPIWLRKPIKLIERPINKPIEKLIGMRSLL